MTYFGGKGQDGVYHAIINQIPSHDVYIEPFLGGGSIMLKKRPAKVNIGVEINKGVAENFLPLFPGAIVKNTCGIQFLSTIEKSAFPSRNKKTPSPPGAGCKNTFPVSSVFIYCDPPYPHSTRGKTRYPNEFTEQDHIDLLRILTLLPFKIAISTYPNDIYSGFLHNWRVIEYKAVTRSGKQVTENLFMNYDEPEILHDDRYIGNCSGNRQDIKRRIERTKSRLLSWNGHERIKLLRELLESIPDHEREYFRDRLKADFSSRDRCNKNQKEINK